MRVCEWMCVCAWPGIPGAVWWGVAEARQGKARQAMLRLGGTDAPVVTLCVCVNATYRPYSRTGIYSRLLPTVPTLLCAAHADTTVIL